MRHTPPFNHETLSEHLATNISIVAPFDLLRGSGHWVPAQEAHPCPSLSKNWLVSNPPPHELLPSYFALFLSWLKYSPEANRLLPGMQFSIC